jgi:site-specific DNA recombinase
MRIHPVELPHLAISSPTKIPVAGILQIDTSYLLEISRCVEMGGKLVSKRFVMDKAVCARRADCLLVEPLCMWMGGNVPLGYDASARTLVINSPEAATVRRIFALYRELGCVRRVKEGADRLGLRTKCTMTANGAERGGKPFSRGHIYKLLSNPIYTGRIAHKGQLYRGQHPALIEDETWTAVRDQLPANAGDHRHKSTAAEPSLLAGLLVDARGERLTPSHAVKKGRRYRYYISAALITEAGTDRAAQAWRLAVQEVEDAVISILVAVLTSPARLLERFDAAGVPAEQIRKILGRAARFSAVLSGSPVERAKLVRGLVEKVMVEENRIIIKVWRGALLGGDVPASASEDPSDSAIELTAPVAFKRRGLQTKLVLPGLTQQNHSPRCIAAQGDRARAHVVRGAGHGPRPIAPRVGHARRHHPALHPPPD